MKELVSLFAGIGGFDLGFQRAGFRVAAHVEKDERCRRLLASKWPEAVSLDDVGTAGAHNLPPCDVVTFGFPCQDLSVAGKRAGLSGGRSGLFYEATRIINELKPAYCLFENVPGLLSSDGGRDFARVLMEMDRIGYCGAWRVLDAQWFGVAQRRRRVFGLFSRLDSGAERCAEILSIAESLRGHPAPSREAGQGVAGCLESRTDGGGFPGTDGACAGHVVPAVAGTLLCGTNRTGGTRRPGENGAEGIDCLIPAVARTVSCNTARGGIPSTDGLDGALIPAVAGCLDCEVGGGKLQVQHAASGHLIPATVRPVMGTITARMFNAMGARDVEEGALIPMQGCDSDTKPGHLISVAQVQWASGGGQTENDTAQALRAGAEHNYQFARLGLSVRRLTPVECERLQGFPDGWTAGFSDSTRYRMLGNAVCVNVSEWIAWRIADHRGHAER